ncbi:LysR family transcriptional regulator [Anaerofustis stercorihominis]|uniref:LysR substrate binding domain protein n=1 Tax=Anaerofustis stercorihominis DSM 17244 TaxID=445971 RepID=B1C5X7_9FIRM|nr:LysR family transcriptional regulator [Anaerofustis stercorihominis]EDS73546.1 LysR substrate binding domain protein [Anaerofustis stercorihominis DSM 17244]MCQ4794649.1 LysR family transcriptional regulator [Anaerofustis stercorihominis]
MNTKSLITFKTILETGSFQKAADTLNYTQSTITFQIKQLEEELSLKLFEKIGRKMELTQAGKDILPYIDTILHNEEQINNYGKSLSEITGSLKLAIPDSILIYNMQPFLQAFLHKAPNIRLIVNSIPSGEINRAVMEGSADIGINCEKSSYPDTVIHKRLGTYKILLVASPFINKDLLDFTTPNQRKPLSLICNEPDGYYQIEMNKYLDQKEIVLNPYMKVQSIEAVKRCVMNNLGIAVVPTYSIEEELKNGSLVPIKTELDEKIFNSIYVYNKNKWLSPQMELALDLLDKKVGIEDLLN